MMTTERKKEMTDQTIAVKSAIVETIKELRSIQDIIHNEPDLFFVADGDGNCLSDRVNHAIVQLAKIGYNL